MAKVVIYRAYPVKEHEQDPIIAEVTEVLTREGLVKKPGIVSELSGVSGSTLHSWLSGKTRSPRYATVMAIMGAFGVSQKFERTSKFNLAEERIDAKRWNLRQKAARLASESKNKRKPEHRTAP
jgi:transcriptional regulator with XRE-family HTH domain